MPVSGYTTTTPKPQTAGIEKILSQLTEQAGIAEAKTRGRQATVEAIYDEIIARYGPGGTYGRAAEAMLEKQKIGDVGMGAQRMISAGLYGTEMGGGLERAWEAEVGGPARLRLEDIKMERLSQAQLGKAGFMERIEDIYPDYGMLTQLISQAAAGPTAPTTTTWGGYEPGIKSEIYGMGVQPSAGVTPATGTYGQPTPTTLPTYGGERPYAESEKAVVYGEAAERPTEERTVDMAYRDYLAYQKTERAAGRKPAPWLQWGQKNYPSVFPGGAAPTKKKTTFPAGYGMAAAPGFVPY